MFSFFTKLRLVRFYQNCFPDQKLRVSESAFWKWLASFGVKMFVDFLCNFNDFFTDFIFIKTYCCELVDEVDYCIFFLLSQVLLISKFPKCIFTPLKGSVYSPEFCFFCSFDRATKLLSGSLQSFSISYSLIQSTPCT